jgi:hypothetical protein
LNLINASSVHPSNAPNGADTCAILPSRLEIAGTKKTYPILEEAAQDEEPLIRNMLNGRLKALNVGQAFSLTEKKVSR